MTSKEGDNESKIVGRPEDSDLGTGSTESESNAEDASEFVQSFLEFISEDEDDESDEAKDRALMLLIEAEDVSNSADRARMIREAMALDLNLVTGCMPEFAEAIEKLEEEDLDAVLTEVFRNHNRSPLLPIYDDPSTLLVSGPIMGEDALRTIEIIKQEMPDCPLKKDYLKWLPRIIALREEGLDFSTRFERRKLPELFPRFLTYKVYHPKRYSVLSDELHAIGAVERSNKYLSLAVRLEPEKSRRRVRLIGSLIEAGDYETALNELQHELELDSESAEYITFTMEQLESDESELANRLYLTLTKLIVEYVDTEGFRMIRPMIDAALSSESPIEGVPDETNVGSLWAHALRLENAGNLPEAIEYLLKAKELPPEDGHLLAYLGKTYFLNGQCLEALEPLRRAVEIYPDNGTYRSVLGSALEEVGRHEEALEQYEASVKLDENYELYAQMVRNLMMLGRHEEANEKLEMARNLAPDNISYIANQALIVNLLGDKERATGLGEEALRKANKDTDVLDLVAFLFSLQGEHARALKVIEQAVALEPENEALLESFDTINRRVPPSATDITMKLRN